MQYDDDIIIVVITAGIIITSITVVWMFHEFSL